MFDAYAREVVERASFVENLEPDTICRVLSKSYFDIVARRVGIGREEVPDWSPEESRSQLRALANTMISAAVFDPLNGVPRTQEHISGAAFVGAEALAFLADIYELEAPDDGADSLAPLASPQIAVRIEAALMYLLGGYDINAVSVLEPVNDALRKTEKAPDGPDEAEHRLIEKLVAFCKGDLERGLRVAGVALDTVPGSSTVYEDLVEEVRALFMDRVSLALDRHLEGLAGISSNFRDAQEAIAELLNILRPPLRTSRVLAEFADIYHLTALVAAAFTATESRALVENVPYPIWGGITTEEYSGYLRSRAHPSDGSTGRCFLWPSAAEYVEKCLPGPARDAVVTFPTGSGKSFVAELGISHALASGWVLYLAPTNALCHQIRRDLSRIFGRILKTKVAAFVGGDEYTTLSEESVSLESERFIAVMTPEKCALSLRLHRHVFAHCRFCVLDECHVINDERRGPITELLLTELALLNPRLRFLLMSAMVANPEDLVSWLSELRGEDSEAVACSVKWRPTRTARSFVFLDSEDTKRQINEAKEELSRDGSERARTIPLGLGTGWMIGLSGAWNVGEVEDYIVSRLGVKAEAKVARRRNGTVHDEIVSWKNTTGRLLAELLGSAGLRTINFILSSKHHAFSQARKVQTIQMSGSPAPIVESWLQIADAELGVQTALRELFGRGVSVHTSAMLPVEQAAATRMFTDGNASVMFATGTLAQGLNLPSLAVVVSGSSIGDPRETDKEAGLIRANEVILNAFGRAGRPTFSNQALVALISDEPFSASIASNLAPDAVLRDYPVLSEPDAAVSITSKMDDFLDALTATSPNWSSLFHDVLFSNLTGKDEQRPGQLLGSTYGGFTRKKNSRPLDEDQLDATVEQARAALGRMEAVPDWVARAAMKSGTSIARCYNIWRAFQQVQDTEFKPSGRTVEDWFWVLIETMKRTNADLLSVYAADESVKTESVQTRLRDLISEADTEGPAWSQVWDELGQVIWRFLDGQSYAQIASTLTTSDITDIKPDRTSGAQPIPRVFKFVKEVVEYGLALDAGVLVAAYESSLDLLDDSSVPEELAALPLCIRNGCNSVGTLAWFRFGFRQRVCARELQEHFTVPDSIVSDSERAKWVRKKRADWLNGRTQVIETSLLVAARKTITDSGNE